MMRRFGERLALALLLGVGMAALPGCERDASGLTEWTPADHDHQVEPRRRRASGVPQTPHAPPSRRNQVIEVTWAKQCANCHGKRGKGDGPQSTMVKARDLTSREWQDTVSDEQLKKVIREGRDKMPAFNLPDSIIDGLVEHVRGLAPRARPRDDRDEDEKEQQEDSPAAAEAPSDAPNVPASSASPPTPAPGAPGDTAAQQPTSGPAR